MAYHQNRGDSFGACLAASIREECCGGKANKLQPGVLSTLLGCQVPFFADNNSLLNFYEKYEDILRAPLGVRVNPLAPNKKVSDQANRAMCWSNMLTAGHDTVRLMDGRCGFLLRFLSYVRMRHGVHRLNSLKIELVDIDHRVSQWHRYMYPCPTVMCLTENIVDMQKPVPSTTLLYLNFCGVAESFDHVRAYLVAHPAKCLFSFSMARAAGKKNFENSLKSLSSAYVKKLPCERKDFVTYVIALTAADAANAVKT